MNQNFKAQAVKGKLVMKNSAISKETFGVLGKKVGSEVKGVKDFSFRIVPSKTEQEMTAYSSGGRDVIYPSPSFSDKAGNVYNHVGVKGTGSAREVTNGGETFRENVGWIGKSADGKRTDKKVVLGMAESRRTMQEFENYKFLHENGIRTAVPIALIEAKEKIGEKSPALFARGFRNIYRITDLAVGMNAERDRLIALSKKIASKEQSFREVEAKYPKKSDDEKLFIWIAGQTAENLAKMHNMGKAHHHVSDHNITLAGELVDLTRMKDAEPIFIADDLHMALRTIEGNFGHGISSREARKVFIRTYEQGSGKKISGYSGAFSLQIEKAEKKLGEAKEAGERYELRDQIKFLKSRAKNLAKASA